MEGETQAHRYSLWEYEMKKGGLRMRYDSYHATFDQLYKEWRQRFWFLYERLQLVFAVLRKPKVIGRRYNWHNSTTPPLDFRLCTESPD